MPKFVSRIPTLFIAALAGAVFGVVGTVAHAATIWGIPVGLVLGILGAAALMLAIRLLADRWASVAAGVGITLAVIVFSGEGPGGSVIAPAGIAAVVWTVRDPAWRNGGWWVNRRPVVCPGCGESATVPLAPAYSGRPLWGGRTCARCGLVYNMWGRAATDG